jgi:hypothetical protein
MNNPLSQQELYQRVSMYLDNALNKDEESMLMQEIRNNPSYLDVLSKEQHFREFIKNQVTRRSVSPTLIQSIKEKIRIAPM